MKNKSQKTPRLQALGMILFDQLLGSWHQA